MTKYLNFFESESGFTEAVEAGQLYYPNVSYTENDDTVHWNLTQPVDPVETPMLRMSFTTTTPGQEVKLRKDSGSGITAMEIDGIPVNVSGDTYSIASPGNHTAVYQFASPAVPERLFRSDSGEFDTFTSAEITSAVTTVSGRAFSGCSGLTSVTIPDSVNTIGNGAFNSCSSLQSVVLPDNLTVIEDFAFTNCQSLQSVVLPDNLTVIKNSAFFGCGSLYEVDIPSGVTSIGVQAFYLCRGLTAIYFNSQVPPTLDVGALDQTTFTSATDCPIYVPAEAVETYKSEWPKYAYRIKTKHRISASVNDEDKGEVMLDQETAPEGDTVGFSVSVFDSEQNQVSSVTVTDGNGDAVEYTDDGDEYFHYYTFTMPDSDVAISVVIEEKEKEKTKHTVTVNSTDDLVTDVAIINEETGDLDWDYEGELSFPEGENVHFAFRVPDGYLAVSAQASDECGDDIEAGLYDRRNGVYECFFTMPSCDVNVFITVEADTRPRYNITASVNDDSLGRVDLLHQDIALEGESVYFVVYVFDTGANKITSVTATDGNGDEVRCWWVFDEGDHSRYRIDIPASDVTISVVIGPKQ